MSETFILWALGACGAGFVFLLIRIIQLSVDMKDRVPFKWIEETYSKSLENKIQERHIDNQRLFNEISLELKEIKSAVIGTLMVPGITARLTDQDKAIKRVEDQVKKLCDGCKYYKDNHE